MSSKVQICNLAMSRIGAARIISLTDGTETANILNTIFDDIADDVMVSGPWTSTIFRAELAAINTTPVYDYAYAYQLPADPYCLKVLDVYEYNSGDTDYKIEGRTILCNKSSLKIRYIGRILPDYFDVMLRRAVVSRIVAETVYTLTGDKSVANNAWNQYYRDVQEALSINNQQGSTPLISADNLIDVR